MTQAEPFPRVIDLQAGTLMVVTDLHGDWDAYQRYRDRFLTLQAAGRADYFLLTGDLIHSEGPAQSDRSLDIVLDLLGLRERLGERLVVLLGNHELPHLYGITLAKGQHLYTPRFEAALGAHRPVVRAFFEGLPFYARTRAGVALCHAGAAAEMGVRGRARRVFDYCHQRVLAETRAQLPSGERSSLRAGLARLNGEPYPDLARRYLAVSGPDDPRYDDLLLGFFASSHPDFRLLWAAMFTKNEREYGQRDYPIFLDALLRDLSRGFAPQEILVSGHMVCRGGYALVAERQLRLASGPHARPRRSGRYLLFDAAKPAGQVEGLLSGLGSVFD